MSELQLFNFQDNQVRVVEIDSNPWFVAADVFKALDIAWRQSDSVSILTDSMKCKFEEDPANSGVVEIPNGSWLISEAGVYKIAFRSNKPEAEAFTNYVAEVILPSVRKTGAYISDTIAPNQIELLLTELIDKVNKLEEDKSHLIHLQAENDQLNKVYEEYPGLKEAITYLKNNIEDNSDSFSLKDYLETKSKLILDRGQRIIIGQLVGSWTKIATNCSLTKIAGSTYYQNKHIKLIDLAIRYVCEI